MRSPRGESESTSAKEKNEKGDVPTAGTGTERRGQGGPEQGPQARSGASREGKDETKSSGRGCSWEETGRVECGGRAAAEPVGRRAGEGRRRGALGAAGGGGGGRRGGGGARAPQSYLACARPGPRAGGRAAGRREGRSGARLPETRNLQSASAAGRKEAAAAAGEAEGGRAGP